MKKLVLSIMVALVLVCTPVRIQASTSECATATHVNPIKYALAVVAAETANFTVETIVKLAQSTRVDDAAFAVCSSEQVIAASTVVINALGFGVECTYQDYVIDGHVVSIDPIRVITPIE